MKTYNLTGSESWSLLKEKTECAGKENAKGYFLAIKDCASQCREEASLFIFGTHDRCIEGGCECFCETAAKSDESCDLISTDGFHLYKYNGNFVFE